MIGNGAHPVAVTLRAYHGPFVAVEVEQGDGAGIIPAGCGCQTPADTHVTVARYAGL